MKTELYVHAIDFRNRAEKAWSVDTVYPGQFDPQNIVCGQGGVSSFGLGLELVQKKDWEVGELAYARGRLLDQSGDVIGPNHSWLEVVHEGICWQVDITPDQYPGIDARMIMQAKGSSDDEVRYATEKATPLDEYNIAKFGARLAIFAEAMDITV